jgi:hypothetical protein
MNSIEAPRPLNLGEILDRTVQLYRERFLVYLGIAIIPTGTVLLVAGGIILGLTWYGTSLAGTSATPFSSPATTKLIVFSVVTVLLVAALPVMLGVSSLSAAAMNHAAAAALSGKRPTIRGSFSEAWRRGWMYVGLYVLQALIVWVAPVGVWFVAFTFLTALMVGARSAAGQAAGALFGLLTLAGFAAIAGYALWMLLCTSLAFPGCVVEKIDAGAALKRSFRLSKGTRGRIFILYLLGAVLGWILSMVVTVIFVIAAAMIPLLNSPQHAQAMGMAMIFLIYGSSFAVQAFTKPVYAIALMLFYYDQRIRKEGFDIEWMMERAGLMPGEAPAPGGETVTRPGEALAFSGAIVAVPGEEPATPSGALTNTAPNGEAGPAAGNGSASAPIDDSVALPVEIDAVFVGQASEQAAPQSAPEPSQPAEAIEATPPAQPETGVP